MYPFERDIAREAERSPFGFGARIGGHRIPLEGDNVTDSERIAALEDAVRSLYAALIKLARAID